MSALTQVNITVCVFVVVSWLIFLGIAVLKPEWSPPVKWLVAQIITTILAALWLIRHP